MYLNIFSSLGDSIKNFFSNIGISVLSSIVSISYWICMFICILGLLAFLAGFKKGGRWSTLGILIYTTLQAILSAIK